MTFAMGRRPRTEFREHGLGIAAHAEGALDAKIFHSLHRRGSAVLIEAIDTSLPQLVKNSRSTNESERLTSTSKSAHILGGLDRV